MESPASITGRFLKAESELPAELRRRILEFSCSLNGGAGDDADRQLSTELETFVQKLATAAYKLTDADFESLRPHYTDEEMYDIIWAATLGAANGRLEMAVDALEACDDE